MAIAGGAAFVLASGWPDTVVARIISALFRRSALSVLRDAARPFRSTVMPYKV